MMFTAVASVVVSGFAMLGSSGLAASDAGHAAPGSGVRFACACRLHKPMSGTA